MVKTRQKQKLIINKSQYIENFRNITQVLGEKPAAALKHNAYGIGILPVAEALDEAGCEAYVLNFLEEAILLRKHLKNVKTIITLEYTNKEDLPEYIAHDVILTIAGMEELDFLLPYLSKEHKINLYFDTGLSGKGFVWSEAQEVFDKVKNLNIQCVMSHLSSAWREDNINNNKQLNRFKEIRKVFAKLEKQPMYSISNTDGSRLGQEYTLDMVRHGRGMHGLSYYEGKFNIKQAFRLIGQVHQVKKLEENSQSGYGGLVEIPNGHNVGIVDVGDYYIAKINFKFTKQVKWKNKLTGEVRLFNVMTVALGYSIVDFEECTPEYLDEVEFVFVSRFDPSF